jgi:hypothetical protein
LHQGTHPTAKPIKTFAIKGLQPLVSGNASESDIRRVKVDSKYFFPTKNQELLLKYS